MSRCDQPTVSSFSTLSSVPFVVGGLEKIDDPDLVARGDPVDQTRCHGVDVPVFRLDQNRQVLELDVEGAVPAKTSAKRQGEILRCIVPAVEQIGLIDPVEFVVGAVPEEMPAPFQAQLAPLGQELIAEGRPYVVFEIVVINEEDVVVIGFLERDRGREEMTLGQPFGRHHHKKREQGDEDSESVHSRISFLVWVDRFLGRFPTFSDLRESYHNVNAKPRALLGEVCAFRT